MNHENMQDHENIRFGAIRYVQFCNYIVIFFSVTNYKQGQHVYDYVTTQPLTTRAYNQPVKKLSSNNDNIVMDINPAYEEATNKSVKANEDAEYETVDSQCRQIKTDDIKMAKNPAYAETKFT